MDVTAPSTAHATLANLCFAEGIYWTGPPRMVSKEHGVSLVWIMTPTTLIMTHFRSRLNRIRPRLKRIQNREITSRAKTRPSRRALQAQPAGRHQIQYPQASSTRFQGTRRAGLVDFLTHVSIGFAIRWIVIAFLPSNAVGVTVLVARGTAL